MSLIGVRKFKDMPLSTPTQRGLAAARFKELTAIQRATIPHALCGRDVLGAAKTGSGKTLAFVMDDKADTGLGCKEDAARRRRTDYQYFFDLRHSRLSRAERLLSHKRRHGRIHGSFQPR